MEINQILEMDPLSLVDFCLAQNDDEFWMAAGILTGALTNPTESTPEKAMLGRKLFEEIRPICNDADGVEKAKETILELKGKLSENITG